MLKIFQLKVLFAIRCPHLCQHHNISSVVFSDLLQKETQSHLCNLVQLCSCNKDCSTGLENANMHILYVFLVNNISSILSSDCIFFIYLIQLFCLLSISEINAKATCFLEFVVIFVCLFCQIFYVIKYYFVIMFVWH